MNVSQWESYHRSGAIATCPTAPDGGYDLEVREAWVRFFATLPQSARILDVGCGNGVIALIAKDTAASLGSAWEIHATDLATTDPRHLVPDGVQRLEGIAFHPGVPTERLPFPDGHFDAVCGHYSLEYADARAALAELHRVLRAGGEAQFVMHHTESVLMKSARVSMREADLVFNETKIYKRLERLVSMHQIVPGTTQKVADELREAIRTLKQALPITQKVGGGRVLSVALDGVQKLLAARTEINSQAAALEVTRAERELRDAIRRLRDLVEHARSPEQMEALQSQAADTGFDLIEYFPLYHGGNNLVGWQLIMRRA